MTDAERPETVPPPHRSVGRVWIAASALFAIAAIAGSDLPSLTSSLFPAPWWTVLPIAAGYALAVRIVFHVEHRNDAVTFSISEAPTAFALVFLDPVSAVVARLVGSLPILSYRRRQEPFKIAFNASLFTVETTLAYWVVAAVVGTAGAQPARIVIGVAIGTASSTLVGAIAVAVAIACFRGQFFSTLADQLRTAALTGSIATLIATVSITPALIDVRLAAVGLLPVAGVWQLLIRHGRLAQRHRDLEHVHDFHRTVGGSLRIDELAEAALAEITRELRAGRGTLTIIDADQDVVVELHVGGGVPVDATEASRSIVDVAIADARGTLGRLRLADRHVAADRFDDDDVKRAGLLADQVAVSLRNALLYGEIEHSALHDPLIDELNRRGFEQAVTADLAATDGRDVQHATIILDLDRFKEINDTFGHQIGDRVIVEFARRLRDGLAEGDRLGRLGGDEFAVFAQRSTEDEVRQLVDRLVDESRRALRIDDYQLVVSASVGVALASNDERDASELVRRADVAMYAAKRTHVGSEFYRSDMDRRTPERLALLADLRDALDTGALDVHFQPKFAIGTSQVVGAEALVRWDHPVVGPISPPDFIRVAEESGLICLLTDQVLRKSLAVAATWADAGFDLGVAVNLSALDLVDVDLPHRVESTLAECAIDPGRLTLEITESSLLVDTPRTMATVTRLRELGVRLSLDDFGTGYSSLSYLQRLPAHELKIDRSFVSSMLLDSQDEVIVRSTIDLGHHLGMVVVAEGIENETTLQRLRELDCDLGQGFGISRPLPAEQFMRWLRSSPHDVRRHAFTNVVALDRLTLRSATS